MYATHTAVILILDYTSVGNLIERLAIILGGGGRGGRLYIEGCDDKREYKVGVTSPIPINVLGLNCYHPYGKLRDASPFLKTE